MRAVGIAETTLQKRLRSSYFDKCSQIPCLTNEELKKLGKWYVSTGKEWICHSDYELEEFKNIFLNFISPEERDNISFDSDFMPFQQS